MQEAGAGGSACSEIRRDTDEQQLTASHIPQIPSMSTQDRPRAVTALFVSEHMRLGPTAARPPPSDRDLGNLRGGVDAGVCVDVGVGVGVGMAEWVCGKAVDTRESRVQS